MKCLCTRTCFLDHEGAFKQYQRGSTCEFEVCPPHFISLSRANIDLDDVAEEALFESDVETEDIRKEAEKRFGLKLRKDLKRKTVVSKFVSIRNRYTEPPTELDPATGKPVKKD